MNNPLHQQVLAYLQTLIIDKPLYAIVDAAQDEQVIELLQQHAEKTRLQSLFEGEQGEEMAPVAPYLLQFNTPDNPMLHTIVQHGWGKNWGLYFDYPGEFEAARNQLRQCIRVKDNDSDYLTFRFYDPRVFRQYISTFDMSQLIAFFGAIGNYWLEDEKTTGVLHYQIRDLQLHVQAIDLQSQSL